MDFGLGLVLSFTDNASAGINNAVNSLNQLTEVAEGASNSLNSIASLSALSVVSGQLGNSFTAMGSTIISTLSQIISKVNDTGTSMLQAENQLGKLYEGSGRTGKDVLKDIQTYAKESIFNFEDLIPVVTMLKANGIEAFDKIASSTGNANQTLMDYAADLAAFNPQMRNAYGTGIQAAMGALNEYIAEGNAKSLKSGASLDITALLGEDKGKTIEERSRQVADLLEKLNMVGMTAQLAGTPMQRLGNMEDVLFDVTSRIASSGVYDEFSKLIEKISEYVFAIPDDELQNIADTIGSTLTALMKPIEKVVDGLLSLCDSIRSLIANNPSLAKFATIEVAIGGVLLLLTGIALKATSALSGLSLMVLAFGKSFNSIGSLLKTGVLKIFSTLLPLVVTIGLLRYAWKNDLAGIKTTTINTLTNLQNAFKNARKGIEGNVLGLKIVLNHLDTEHNIFDRITLAIIKLGITFKALVDAWDDYELSEELFLKAQELGILPLIEALLDLKYRFGFFQQGFMKGWDDIGEKVRAVVGGIANSCKGTIFEDLANSLVSFLNKLSSGDTESWYLFGESFAHFTANAVLFWGAFKVVDGILGKVIKLGVALNGIGSALNIGGKIAGKLASLFPSITKVLEKGIRLIFGSNISGVLANLRIIGTVVLDSITTTLSGIGSAILTFLGGLSAPILAVIAIALSGIIAYVTTHWEEFKAKMMTIWETLTSELHSIFDTLFEGLKSIWDKVVDVFQSVKEAFAGLISSAKELWDALGQNETVQEFVEVLSSIGEAIVSILVPVVRDAIRLISDLIKGIIKIVVEVLGGVIDVVGSILRAIIDIVKGVIDIIIGIVNGDGSKILEGVQTILTALWNVLSTILTAIWNIIQSVLSTIANVVTTIVQTIVNFIGGVMSGLFSIVQGAMTAIFTIIKTIWNNISTTISNVLGLVSSSVQQKWDNIANAISDKIEWARDKVHDAIEAIKGFFNFDWKLPELKLPHFKVKGDFSVNPPSVPTFDVDWYANGGVFDKPSLIGVGEAGTEAVMPLENNTEWIGVLANMITSKMSQTSMTPVSGNPMNSNVSGGDTSYLTNNNTTQNIGGNTDNSIVFNQGAIQVNVQNATEEEAIRLAKFIMEYIQRQRELNSMAKYA